MQEGECHLRYVPSPILDEIGPPSAVERLDADGHGGVARGIMHYDRIVLYVESKNEMIGTVRSAGIGTVGELAHIQWAEQHRSLRQVVDAMHQ